MFWGLTLEGGKHYSQSVEDSFHVSMAALELENDYKEGKSPVRVMIQHQKKEFLLCSLICGTLAQQQLDLDFTEGEEIIFYLEGEGVVHLTGFLVQETPYSADEEEVLGSPESSEDGMDVSSDNSEEDEDETLPSLQQLARGLDLDQGEESDDQDWTPEEKVELAKKRKMKDQNSLPSKKNKKSKNIQDKLEENEDSDDEHSTDDDEIAKEIADLLEDNGNLKQKEGQKSKPKHIKTKQTGPAGDDGKTARKTKKNKEKKIEGTTQSPKTSRNKLSNGVIIEDIIVGSGKIAKPSKMVGVFYKGMLAKSKKEFDSCLSGKPFRFKLGTKEVITGWDTGLAGMRVGGKRRLTIPAPQGYGKKQMGTIPPNSTLLFDVELKEVR